MRSFTTSALNGSRTFPGVFTRCKGMQDWNVVYAGPLGLNRLPRSHAGSSCRRSPPARTPSSRQPTEAEVTHVTCGGDAGGHKWTGEGGAGAGAGLRPRGGENRWRGCPGGWRAWERGPSLDHRPRLFRGLATPPPRAAVRTCTAQGRAWLCGAPAPTSGPRRGPEHPEREAPTPCKSQGAGEPRHWPPRGSKATPFLQGR